MTELDKNTRFLSRLVAHENVDCQAVLSERLKQASAHERTLRRATAAVAVLGMASVSGIGYSTVFATSLPDAGPILLKLCYITGLASLICLIGFLIFWAQTRSMRHTVIEECRTSILKTIEHGRPVVPCLTPLPTLRELSEPLPESLPERKLG